jgi:nucleotide-binding universal stress UspA family protein
VAAGTIDPAIVIWHRLRPRPGVSREELRNVIVAGEGEASLSVASEVAAANGAAVVLVAACHPLLDDAGDLEAGLERQAAGLRERVPSVRTVVRRGDLGAILLDEAIAERARLIVVADAGADHGITGRLVGSAWDHVSHHARCDVLVAR